MKPGHLQSAAVRLCYSNVSHLTHAPLSEGIKHLLGAEGCRGEPPPWPSKQTAVIDKWDLVGRLGVSSGRSIGGADDGVPLPFPWKQSDTHGGYESHMWLRCHCSRTCFSKCVTKCAGSQIGSVASPTVVFLFFLSSASKVTRTELYRLPLLNQCLKCNQDRALFFLIISLGDDKQRLKNYLFQTNMLIQSAWGFEAKPSKPQSTLIHHFSSFCSCCQSRGQWGQHMHLICKCERLLGNNGKVSDKNVWAGSLPVFYRRTELVKRSLCMCLKN